MKKIISFMFIFAMFSLVVFPVSTKKVEAKDKFVLNIINTEEYIAEEEKDENGKVIKKSIIDGFIDYYAQTHNGQKITVNYSTQGTNENMYSQIDLHPNHYDLVCVSEYMVQKMMIEGKLEKLDHTKLNNYDNNVTPVIENIFKNSKMETKKGIESLYDYACCYMWGTMGYVYNPKYVSKEEAESWDVIWKEEYRNKGTIKNSIRDSYVLAIGYSEKEKLLDLARQNQEGTLSDGDYNRELTKIFNEVSDEMLEKTGRALMELTPKLYGFEVDSGKRDMASGKLWLNFAWSGDAVYSLDYAEDEEMVGKNTTKLYYAVPKEGSNIFFDAWAMPKGANTELAQEFLNYIQHPENAIRNMDYVGYTTAIANDQVFEHLVSPDGFDYGYKKGNENVYFKNGIPYVKEDGKEVELYEHNINYIFGKQPNDKYIIYAPKSEEGRQLDTQYPTEDIVKRCTIMRHFNDEELNKLTKMWHNVTSSNIEELPALYITIIITLLVFIVIFVMYIIDKKELLRYDRTPKGYKVVAINGKPVEDEEEDK